MSGQARVTIKNKQWNVSVAATPLELTQGLGGLPGIPAQSGMLFDLGIAQIIQVTTIPMLFPLDIAFLSETLAVTEVYRNVQPGYLVTSDLPARYFLEVNAGELEGIDSGDQASVEVITPAQTIEPVINWMLMFGMMMAFIPFLLMGVFMVSMVRVVTDLVFEKPKEKPRLPPRTERLKLLPRTKPTAVKSPMREPEVMRYRVEENKPYGTWAVVELWATGTVRSPFPTKEEAIKREEEIGDYFGWKLQRVEFTKAQEALLDPQRFPRRTEALSRLQGYDVIEVHDDGDLTVRSRGRFYVVTTEGELFAHHTGGEALRMKIAALALTRKGYPVYVETVGRELWIIFLEQKVDGSAETLAALWRPDGTKVGTKFHIIGYTGDAFADRFAVNLPRPAIIAEGPSPLTRPVRRFNQLIRYKFPQTESSRIFARDIYMRDINSPFSYNLWGFDMAPDRMFQSL